MLKAQELRIGNWYKQDMINGDYAKITVSDIAELIDDPLDDFYQPIPLTEDWLVKFGFENGIEFKIKFNFFRFHLFQINKSNEFNDNINEFSVTLYQSKQSIEICRLKYVHELQNLYYTLTNQELTCN